MREESSSSIFSSDACGFTGVDSPSDRSSILSCEYVGGLIEGESASSRSWCSSAESSSIRTVSSGSWTWSSSVCSWASSSDSAISTSSPLVCSCSSISSSCSAVSPSSATVSAGKSASFSSFLNTKGRSFARATVIGLITDSDVAIRSQGL